MTSFQKHKQRWINCTRCELCKKRKRVVLARGKLPSPILFIGEAPGASEDVIGKPFCGPAGKMLNHIIKSSLDGQWDYAITNLVACIPKDSRGNKIHEPSERCIRACAPRLSEMYDLCDPSLVVRLGKLPAKYGDPPYEHQNIPKIDLIHPAAILRMGVSQRQLAIKRSIVALEDAVDSLIPF